MLTIPGRAPRPSGSRIPWERRITDQCVGGGQLFAQSSTRLHEQRAVDALVRHHADITLRPWARAQGSFCDSIGRTLVCVSGCHHSVTQVQ